MKIRASSFRLSAVFGTLLLLGAACGAPVAEGDATRGEGLYGANCAQCHGDDAKGGSAGEDLPGALAEDGFDEVFGVIKNGEGDEMPAFGDQLSDEQIKDIIAWLETQ